MGEISRSERRRLQRDKQKLEDKIRKLDGRTTLLINQLADERLEMYIKTFGDMITDAIYQGCRENRVGHDRTENIIKRIDDIMREKANESQTN